MNAISPIVAADPFLITGPAVISFSGGRTSGYMLWRILQAHGGTLPDDVAVCFANTGREMPATLDFVQECASRWGVRIRWVEFVSRAADGFQEVSHNSASRDGAPLERVFRAKQMLPNPVMRFCTEEAKIRTIRRFVRATFGWQGWLNVVGLRADEMGRVNKLTEGVKRSARDRALWPAACPLATDGVVEEQVRDFWLQQPFDLRLNGKWEGNCDGCFLKSRGAISRMLRDHPDRMAWWARMEAERCGVTYDPKAANFRSARESYADLAAIVERQGVLPLNIFDDRMECQWTCTD